MDFHPIDLTDKEWMDPILQKSGFQGCDYSFGNLFIWKDLYKQEVTLKEGMLCTRSIRPQTGEVLYLFPAGDGDIEKAIDFMWQDAKKRQVPFLLRGFNKNQAELLKDIYMERLTIESAREEWDYIYEAENLRNLSGKKYHGKRNHITRFMEDNNWEYTKMTCDHLKECMEMSKLWYQEHDSNDRSVVENAFRYFNVLGMTGGILRSDGRVIAFCIGEPLTSDTYVVHIEKAFADVNGAYPMINKQYVMSEMNGYLYVNREEDDGLLGLRKAKESYHPIMLEKYVAKEV